MFASAARSATWESSGTVYAAREVLGDLGWKCIMIMKTLVRWNFLGLSKLENALVLAFWAVCLVLYAGCIWCAQLYKTSSRWRLGSLCNTSYWDNSLKFIISSITIIKVSYREQITRNIRTADCISACLTAASGGGGAALRRRRASLGRRSLNGSNLALALGLLGGSVPVVDHLHSENGIQGEASDESVKDQLVVNLLESSKDAREGSGEVVENLYWS